MVSGKPVVRRARELQVEVWGVLQGSLDIPTWPR